MACAAHMKREAEHAFSELLDLLVLFDYFKTISLEEVPARVSRRAARSLNG